MADTIKTNLGPVTAYADAKAHGYTGTREEFGALLANAGLNLKAAETAKEGAEAAKEAAETAQQADAAKESATGAANSASAAQESETNAGQAATAAANAAVAAKQAQNAAETAKADAEAAKATAGSSADAAANSAADAKKTLESIPEDYSTLSGKVDENTSGISQLKEETFPLYTLLNDSDFKAGSISFTDSSRTVPMFAQSNSTYYCILANCRYFKLKIKYGEIALLALDRTTGVWLSAEKSTTVISKDKLSDYILVYTGTLGNNIEIKALFDEYPTGVFPLTNTGSVLLYRGKEKKRFTVNSSIRLMSGVINGIKNISVSMLNAAYQVMLFYTNGNGEWESTSWGNSASLHVQYEFDCAISFRKTDNTNITDDEIRNQFTISYGNKINDCDVVHYSVNVIDRNGTACVDESILVLPPNYDPNGQAIRLVIVCHGAGATRYSKLSMDDTGKIIGDPQRVLTKMGYAVLDTFAGPYGVVGTNYSGLHYGSPIVLSCYKASINYALTNYNIKKDGICVCGSSMGGLSALQLITMGGYNIIASVLYCPCVDLYKEAWCNPWNVNGRNSMAKLFGFDGDAPAFGSTFPPSEEEKEYFKNNISKMMGYYPMLFDTEMSFTDLFNAFPSTATGLDEEAESKVYNKYKKFLNVPIRLFHCKNDSTMAYRYTKYFHDMLKNGDAITDFVSYETGGHAAWTAGDDVTLTDVMGNEFVCKESQALGYYWLKSFGA